MKLTFTIPGTPKAQERARAVARIYWKDGQPRALPSLYTSKETRQATAAVRKEFQRLWPEHRPWTGPVMLRVSAYFPIPKSWPKYLQAAARSGRMHHTGKPDKDNCEKLIADALNGIAWADDGQVQGGGVKFYSDTPRTVISLELIEQPDLPATPGQKRAEARLDAPEDGSAPRRPRADPHKSSMARLPDGVRQAVERKLVQERLL